MVKHVVMWKFKSGTQEKMYEFLNALKALDGKINALCSMEIGVNQGSDDNYDAVLITTFKSFEDLKAYANHPLHVAASSLCKEIRLSRAAVDFTIE